jgi:hypothetical protein
MTAHLTDADRRTADLETDDELTVSYESVHGAADDRHTVEGTVVDRLDGCTVDFETVDGDRYQLVTDHDDDRTATELKKFDAAGTARRVGYPEAVVATIVEPSAPADLDAAALADGQALEVTYSSNNSAATTRTVYVLDVYDRSASSIDRSRPTLIAADPSARRSRTVRIDLDDTFPTLRSLNSKSDTGRRVGRVDSCKPLPQVSEPHAAAAAVRRTTEGEVVDVAGDTAIVIDTTHGVEAESVAGRTYRLRARTDGAHLRVNGDHDGAGITADYERVGTEHHNGIAADAFETWAGYGRGHDDGKVVALQVDGVAYEVVYRHEADDTGLRLASPTVGQSRRNIDARLTCDPIGLTLITGLYHPDREARSRRLTTDEVAVVRVGDRPDSDDSGSGEHEADDGEPTVVTDGGRPVDAERQERRRAAAEHDPLLVAEPPLAGADLSAPFVAVAARACDVWVVEFDDGGPNDGTERVTTERFRIGSDGEASIDPAGNGDRRSIAVRHIDRVEWYGPLDHHQHDRLVADGGQRRLEDTDTDTDADVVAPAAAAPDSEEPRDRRTSAWERRDRPEQIAAHRRVAAAVPVGPQANLGGFDTFGAVRSEVSGSVLLAADAELETIGADREDSR